MNSEILGLNKCPECGKPSLGGVVCCKNSKPSIQPCGVIVKLNIELGGDELFIIKDDRGGITYIKEEGGGYRSNRKYDDNGSVTYFEDDSEYWVKQECDDNDNVIRHEDSDGEQWTATYDGKTMTSKVDEHGVDVLNNNTPSTQNIN